MEEPIHEVNYQMSRFKQDIFRLDGSVGLGHYWYCT